MQQANVAIRLSGGGGYRSRRFYQAATIIPRPMATWRKTKGRKPEAQKLFGGGPTISSSKTSAASARYDLATSGFYTFT